MSPSGEARRPVPHHFRLFEAILFLAFQKALLCSSAYPTRLFRAPILEAASKTSLPPTDTKHGSTNEQFRSRRLEGASVASCAPLKLQTHPYMDQCLLILA